MNEGEVEARIRQIEEEMARSSLSIQQEKTKMQEMKQLRKNQKLMQEWEREREDVQNKGTGSPSSCASRTRCLTRSAASNGTGRWPPRWAWSSRQ